VLTALCQEMEVSVADSRLANLVIPDGCPAKAGRKSGTHTPGVSPACDIG